MVKHFKIKLATERDAQRIAEMSRDMIESGLGWSWTPQRILDSIRDKNTNVAVAYENQTLIGFAIMEYEPEECHLVLLATAAAYRRKRVASTLLTWLEKTALTAGIGVIYLEARMNNLGARAFYRRLGYREIKVITRYYRGRESAVRIAKDLWLGQIGV
jgi:ribosomal-protein-alanine N-acetyltransferase